MYKKLKKMKKRVYIYIYGMDTIKQFYAEFARQRTTQDEEKDSSELMSKSKERSVK